MSSHVDLTSEVSEQITAIHKHILKETAVHKVLISSSVMNLLSSPAGDIRKWGGYWFGI